MPRLPITGKQPTKTHQDRCQKWNGPALPARWHLRLQLFQQLLDEKLFDLGAVLQFCTKPAGLAASARPRFVRIVGIDVFGRNRASLSTAAAENVADLETRVGNLGLEVAPQLCPAALFYTRLELLDFQLEGLQLPQRHF